MRIQPTGLLLETLSKSQGIVAAVDLSSQVKSIWIEAVNLVIISLTASQLPILHGKGEYVMRMVTAMEAEEMGSP